MAKSLKKLLTIFTKLVVVMLPLSLAQFLLSFYHESSLDRLVPIWVDEIFYWHQAVSFGAAGLNTGYYTVAEIPADFGFSHFYSWGLLIPSLYGSLGYFFNWNLAFIPILNIIFLSLSIAAFLYFLRANIWQTLFIATAILSFSPFIIYSMSSLLPILEQAIGIGLGLCFYLYIQNRNNSPIRFIIILAFFLVFASFVRVWWSILFLPYALLLVKEYSLRNIILATSIAVVTMIVIVWLASNLASPYPYWYSNIYETTGLSENIFSNIQKNLNLFNEGNILEIWLRREYLLLIALTVVAMGLLLWRSKDNTKGLVELGLGTYMLLGILAFVIILYDVAEWRDYRILSPVMLMILKIYIASKRYWIVLTIIALNLWLLPETLKVYEIWSSWHVDSQTHNAYFAWNAELEKVMVYEAEASNAWCNTVLHSEHYLFVNTSSLLAVDAGIGLSSPLFLESYELPFRSRYLMLDNETYAQLEDSLNVQVLMTIPDGQLYLNLDSDCPDSYVSPLE